MDIEQKEITDELLIGISKRLEELIVVNKKLLCISQELLKYLFNNSRKNELLSENKKA